MSVSYSNVEIPIYHTLERRNCILQIFESNFMNLKSNFWSHESDQKFLIVANGSFIAEDLKSLKFIFFPVVRVWTILRAGKKNFVCKLIFILHTL